MARYVALLRAINVGGHTVKMEELRRLFTEIGLSDVSTLIASGNVIFETPKRDVTALERKIEAHLREALGYDVATFIRSTSELAAIAAYEPFPDAPGDEGSLYVAFLPAPPAEEAREKLMSYRTEVDDFHVHGREIYWRPASRVSASTFSGAVLEKAIRMPATMRNVTTVRKLAALHPATR
jgi:uncharacterized protein (DUF1697 family)